MQRRSCGGISKGSIKRKLLWLYLFLEVEGHVWHCLHERTMVIYNCNVWHRLRPCGGVGSGSGSGRRQLGSGCIGTLWKWNDPFVLLQCWLEKEDVYHIPSLYLGRGCTGELSCAKAKRSFGSTCTRKKEAKKASRRTICVTPKISDFLFRRWWPISTCGHYFAMLTA